MAQRITQVDAFSSVPFGGNPAAVCLLAEARDERWMQQIASEMNLSETAFLVRRVDGFDLRWFTPAAEVDLCGHATLASAHILWEEGQLAAGEQARFHTRSGLLTADQRAGWIEMDFPANVAEPAALPEGLLAALGLETEPVFSGRSRFDYLLEVADEATVRGLQPNFSGLTALEARGIIVTSRAGASDAEYDFVSRFFAPKVGVNEDPVTGSAHVSLSPYWSQLLGRAELVGYQASARGGIVRVRHNGERVILAGKAVTVLRGELYA